MYYLIHTKNQGHTFDNETLPILRSEKISYTLSINRIIYTKSVYKHNTFKHNTYGTKRFSNQSMKCFRPDTRQIGGYHITTLF